jgi:hypothetical protein
MSDGVVAVGHDMPADGKKLLVPLLVPTTIRNAKPRNKLYKLSERGGLQRLVKPNGVRLWWFAHRFAGRQKPLAM